MSEILVVSRSLGEFPLIGRAVPELGDARIRERLIYSYRLMCRLEEHGILVVAVVHGKRLLEDVPGRFGAR